MLLALDSAHSMASLPFRVNSFRALTFVFLEGVMCRFLLRGNCLFKNGRTVHRNEQQKSMLLVDQDRNEPLSVTGS